MIGHRTVLNCASILLSALFMPPATLASNQIELKWSELAPAVINQQVKLVLPDRTEIQGQAVAIREDALVLNIKKTSDSKGYPKGQSAIPRKSVSTLQFETVRGSGGRTIGLIVGALGGLILGGDLVAHTANSEAAGIASFLGISTGSAIAGYYAGRRHDRQITIVKILPEQ